MEQGTSTFTTTRDQGTDPIRNTVDKSTQVSQDDIKYIPPIIDFATQTYNMDYYCPATIFRPSNIGPPTPTQDELPDYHNAEIVISDDEEVTG